MKALKLGLLFISIGVLLTFSNCGGGGSTPEPLADQQFTKLAKTWKIKTVTSPVKDVTVDYTGFTLTISGTKGAASYSYATAGRPPIGVWKASGSWIFGANPVTDLVRDPDSVPDKQNMTYAVTATTLQITFNFPAGKLGYSRSEQVTGDWIFTFQL